MVVRIENTPLASPYAIVVLDGVRGRGHPQARPYDAIDTARLVNGGSTTEAWKELADLSKSPESYGGMKGIRIQNVDSAKGTHYSGETPLKFVSMCDDSAPKEITLADPRAPMSIEFHNYCHDHGIAIRLGKGGPVLR